MTTIIAPRRSLSRGIDYLGDLGAKLTSFMFDGGWKNIAEEGDEPEEAEAEVEEPA